MNAKVDNATDTVTIEVDGVEIQARKGAMLIEATDNADIHVPRFCYHRKLSIAANCRMCLVDVEKAPKPLPACATPVADGMKVRTRSERALKAQKGVMEFLLINHPLDCPICDQGGECELQDLAMGYGRGVSRFSERKRVVRDENLGPLIATEMTRCIHCTRCVRFLDEVAGQPELGGMGRGEHMTISTYVERGVSSEMSGNIIDLCPVGALTSKPFRFSARAWEMLSHPAVSPHDCTGSNLQIHHLNGRVKRVVPREQEEINECWIADRDRFSYQGLYSGDRLTAPMVKRDGEWHEVDWETALGEAAECLRNTVREHGPDALGALISPSATVEEMYLLGRLVRGLGSRNIDARIRTGDFSDQIARPPFPASGLPLADIDRLDTVLVFGGNPRNDHPIINHRLRKATLNGARIHFVDPCSHDINYPVAGQYPTHPDDMVALLAAVAESLLEGDDAGFPDGLRELIGETPAGGLAGKLAAALAESDNPAILLGPMVEAHPRGAVLRSIAQIIARKARARVAILTDGANTAGAWLAGAVPHREAGGGAVDRPGLDARAMMEQPLRAYLLHALEPEQDCWDAAAARAALEQADSVVVMTTFLGEGMQRYADVLLPVGGFGETSGSFVSVEGRWQSFPGVAPPQGQGRPAWKVLRVLGNLLEVDGFDYHASDEITDEVRGLCGELQVQTEQPWQVPEYLRTQGQGLVRAGTAGIYAGDPLVRRAEALQATPLAREPDVIIGPGLARELELQDGSVAEVRQGDVAARAVVGIREGVAEGVVWMPSGSAAAAGLGPLIGPVTLTRA